jgi:hypothetical protein
MIIPKSHKNMKYGNTSRSIIDIDSLHSSLAAAPNETQSV